MKYVIYLYMYVIYFIKTCVVGIHLECLNFIALTSPGNLNEYQLHVHMLL